MIVAIRDGDLAAKSPPHQLSRIKKPKNAEKKRKEKKVNQFSPIRARASLT